MNTIFIGLACIGTDNLSQDNIYNHLLKVRLKAQCLAHSNGVWVLVTYNIAVSCFGCSCSCACLCSRSCPVDKTVTCSRHSLNSNFALWNEFVAYFLTQNLNTTGNNIVNRRNGQCNLGIAVLNCLHCCCLCGQVAEKHCAKCIFIYTRNSIVIFVFALAVTEIVDVCN